MIYALIKNNVVVNTIIADQSFINQDLSGYDLVLSFDESQWYPGPGMIYNADGSFSNPPEDN